MQNFRSVFDIFGLDSPTIGCQSNDMKKNKPILQPAIPEQQRYRAEQSKPGMVPVAPGDWLQVDAAYSAQLKEKARLIRSDRNKVIACLPEAEDAVGEALAVVLAELAMRPDFQMLGRGIKRPDGKIVEIDARDPLVALSMLIQEDICILQKKGDEHILAAALLCFPASWTLAQKLGRPMVGIHKPVTAYTEDLARRVQRLLDGVQPGRPVWRANLLHYNDPALFQPRLEGDEKDGVSVGEGYLRSERQTLLRLPGTGSVVFSIHTTLVKSHEV